MDDLIARLTVAIGETERNGYLGQQPLGFVVDGTAYRPDDVQIVYETNGDTPRQAVLRGCAADRKVLAIHLPIEVFNGSAESKYWPKHAGTPGFPITMICERCASEDSERGWNDDDPDVHHPCPTLKATAERYGLEVDSG